MVSRSRTCRSFRSRKARCLRRQPLVQGIPTWLLSTYAALFCAFRRDCAGVRSSLSTLFDLLSCPSIPSLSRSSVMPFSKESLGNSELCCAIGDAELELCAAPGALPPELTDVSKLYSKADGMKPFASNEVSMLYIMPSISAYACLSHQLYFYGSSAYLHSTMVIAASSMSEYGGIIAKSQVSKCVRRRREVIVIIEGLHRVRC